MVHLFAPNGNRASQAQGFWLSQAGNPHATGADQTLSFLLAFSIVTPVGSLVKLPAGFFFAAKSARAAPSHYARRAQIWSMVVPYLLFHD